MRVTQETLAAELGEAGMVERTLLLEEGGAMATALRRAEDQAWPSAAMLADLWRWALWLVMVRGYRAQTTGQRYVQSLARWGGWCAVHGVDYAVAKTEDLDAYMRWLYADQRLAAASRAVMAVAVRSFYAWRSSRRGGRNCGHEVRVPKRPQRMPRKYSAGALRKLFAAIDQTRNAAERVRDRAILLLLYASGIRREELCTLRLADVTIESARMATLKIHGKGAKERLVSVEGPVVSALGEWLEVRRKDPRQDRIAEFFSSVKAGAPLKPEGLERIVKRTAQRAGLREWGVHMFRITFATQLYDDGVDIERIRMALGHESIETTRGYIAVANRQRAVRLASHRQHSVLGSLPADLPAWARKLEEGRT